MNILQAIYEAGEKGRTDIYNATENRWARFTQDGPVLVWHDNGMTVDEARFDDIWFLSPPATEDPEPEVVDVPLEVNVAGRLVTQEQIDFQHKGWAIGPDTSASVLPSYVGPPVTFVKFVWPAQPDNDTWPPEEYEYRVWQNMDTGTWSYYYGEGREVVYAEAARFHVQREADNDRT